MTSIKCVYQNGTVYIQIICNRKKAIRKVFDLESKYWGTNQKVKNSHPNANQLNRLLSSKKLEYETTLYDLQLSESPITLKSLLDPIAKKIEVVPTVCDSIMQKSVEIKDAIKTYRKLSNLKDHFDRFGDMPINEFGYSEMQKFEKFLNSQPRINSLETSARYLKDLKRCLAAQLYNDKKVLNYRLTFGSKPKPKLTSEEIEKIGVFNHSKYQLSRDIFLACFYSWGSRISSILTLRPNNVIDGRLIFLEYKGKNKTKSVKINEKLQTIIDRYAGKSAFYLFPGLNIAPLDKNATKDEIYRYDKHIESKTSVINKELKVIAAACDINKNISTHVARHSFAYISHKNGVKTRLIQMMLGHTTFQMTENYIKSLVVDDELDDAADLIY